MESGKTDNRVRIVVTIILFVTAALCVALGVFLVRTKANLEQSRSWLSRSVADKSKLAAQLEQKRAEYAGAEQQTQKLRSELNELRWSSALTSATLARKTDELALASTTITLLSQENSELRAKVSAFSASDTMATPPRAGADKQTTAAAAVARKPSRYRVNVVARHPSASTRDELTSVLNRELSKQAVELSPYEKAAYLISIRVDNTTSAATSPESWGWALDSIFVQNDAKLETPERSIFSPGGAFYHNVFATEQGLRQAAEQIASTFRRAAENTTVTDTLRR